MCLLRRHGYPLLAILRPAVHRLVVRRRQVRHRLPEERRRRVRTSHQGRPYRAISHRPVGEVASLPSLQLPEG